MLPQRATEWARRIERANVLPERYPATAELLDAYGQVLTFQAGVAEELSSSGPARQADRPLREQVPIDSLLQHLPRLTGLVDRTRRTHYKDGDGLTADSERARGFLEAELRLEVAPSAEPTLERFMAIALLQPAMEQLAQQFSTPESSGNRCPHCDALPLLAVLRPEGEGAKRWLQCSLCLTEWAFRRVLCTWCGETDKEKLPRYTAEECNYVRVEACDTCKRYLKSIDMTVEGHAVPMVDELALAALDVWATEHGFKKISLNMFGL